MRSTVGPLPAAVYWRRRAVVLGALLLGVIVLFVSCSGGDDKDSNRGKGASSQAPISPSASATPEDDPSFTDPGPGAGNPSLPDPGDLTATGTGANPPAGADDGSGEDPDDGTQGGTTDTNVVAAGTCKDDEMSVTAVPAATTIRRGASVAIQLKIKNISARTCSRDVGADLQELYIEQGAGRVWSSDTCSTAKGSDLYSFPPNESRAWELTWNGKQSTKCTAGQAAGTAPPVGQYEMRLRLGAKVSPPVALTITA